MIWGGTEKIAASEYGAHANEVPADGHDDGPLQPGIAQAHVIHTICHTAQPTFMGKITGA